jgi:predicted ATPase
MRISHIKLENWRNFRDVEVALQERAFLVGPNASGKSNFLDALRFLRDLALPGGGFLASVETGGGVSRIRNLSARRPSTIAIEAELHDNENGDHTNENTWRYRIAFSQDSQRTPFLKAEQVWRGEHIILDRPDSDDQTDKQRLRQTWLEQTFANQEFREIADFFASIQYFHLVPQLVRDPGRAVGLRKDPYGEDFLEQIASMKNQARESRLRRILDVLKIAIPQFADLKFDQDQKGVPHLYGKYEHWRPAGAWQTEVDFSDGTLRLIGLLWALLDGEGPLLLEEPELSLHSGIVRYIPQMMFRVQRERRIKRQVLVSTHSEDLLQDEGIAPDEVLLVVPSEGGSTIRTAQAMSEITTLLDSGLSMAEAVIPYTRPADAAQLSLF